MSDTGRAVSPYDPRPDAYELGRALIHMVAGQEEQPVLPDRQTHTSRRQITFRPDEVVVTEEHITTQEYWRQP